MTTMKSSDLGYVVEILVSDDEDKKTPPPSNPRLESYFLALYGLANIFAVLLNLIQLMSEHHPFKAYGSVFMIITIASLSVAVLTSGILISTSYYFHVYMMDIHYTILKSIGLFSAALAPFCLLVLLFVPVDNLNWIAFSVVVFSATYYFLWKHIVVHQQVDKLSELPLHRHLFLWFLVPVFFASLSFISHDSPPWINYTFFCLCLTIAATLIFIVSINVKNKLSSSGSKREGNQRPMYPLSRKTEDWDKLEAQVRKEEKDEKLDGDAALNKFCRDIQMQMRKQEGP